MSAAPHRLKVRWHRLALRGISWPQSRRVAPCPALSLPVALGVSAEAARRRYWD
jgi:hypothetical protein